MRLLAWLLIVAAIAGCGQANKPSAAALPVATASAPPPPSDSDRLFDFLTDAEAKIAAFQKEPKADCRSKNLSAAIVAVDEAHEIASRVDLLPGNQAVASTRLDVADAAKKKGCGKVARVIYDYVVKVYIGSGYSALRQRAVVGIDDLRGKT